MAWNYRSRLNILLGGNTMATPKMLEGKNRFLLFRKLSEQGTEDGIKLVFQTSHTFAMSRAIDKVVTKDGSINKIGELETEVTIEAIQAKDDPVGDMLRDSVYNGEELEVWEVTYDEDLKNEEGKYPAVYAQGNLENWEWTADAEDDATISSTFFVNLKPQFGYTALPEGIEEAVQYAFKEVLRAAEASGQSTQDQED